MGLAAFNRLRRQKAEAERESPEQEAPVQEPERVEEKQRKRAKPAKADKE